MKNLIKILVSVLVISFLAGFILGFVIANPQEQCVKIGESSLNFKTFNEQHKWDCEEQVIPRENEDGYDHYQLVCKEHTVEIYKCK